MNVRFLGHSQFMLLLYIMKRVIIAAIVGVLLVACGGPNAAVQPTPEASSSVEPVQAGNQITVDGRVVPVRSAELAFAATGVISEVLVAGGDDVDAGAVLARLDSTQQDAAVAQAEANVAQAQAALDQLRAHPYPEEIAAAEAALADAVANQDRMEQGSSSDEEKDAAVKAVVQAETELNVLKAGPRQEELAAAKAEVDAAEAALAQARADQANAQLRAPFAGTVAFVDLDIGEVVVPGTPVVQLADLSQWQIETEDLTELNVVRIEQGDAATVRIDAIPELELRGTVEHIGSYGENQQGDIVYRVVVALAESDERLRWNMTAAVTIEAGE